MAKSSGQSSAKSAPQRAAQGSGSKQQASPRAQQSPDTDTDVEEDEIYALVSVLYHALQDASASRKYIQDAQSADDGELVEFFQRCREDDRERAKEAKLLLVARIDEEDDDDDDEGGSGTAGGAGEEGDEDED